jgi:ribonuclease HII
MDEVGRGALAGPVSVGVVVVDVRTRTAPAGVRDSKLLTAAAREALAPRLRRWALSHGVGHAEPEEVDRHGIIAALGLAGRRALAALPQVPTCVLLDGSHDWLSPPRPRGAIPRQEEVLFEIADAGVPAGPPGPAMPLRLPAPTVPLACDPRVLTLVKADLRCAAVAAASVLAKVERDAIMVERSARHPEYRWHENKGYSAPEHAEALRRFGPCDQHRRTWSLPGQGDPFGPGQDPDVVDPDAVDLVDLDDLEQGGVDLAGAGPVAVDLRAALDPVPGGVRPACARGSGPPGPRCGSPCRWWPWAEPPGGCCAGARGRSCRRFRARSPGGRWR